MIRRKRTRTALHALLALVLAPGGWGCSSESLVDGGEPAGRVAAIGRLAELRAKQEAPGFEFERMADGTWSAPIGAARDTVARLDGDRVAVAPNDGSFGLAIRTTGVGRRGELHAEALTATRAVGQEAALVRPTFEERVLAGPRGLEQTFHLAERPPGQGPLVIEVAFDGLTPRRTPGRMDQVELIDTAGSTRAVYGDLAAIDAGGRELLATLEVNPSSAELVIDDTDAAYPIDIDPLVVMLESKLDPGDGKLDFGFGGLVSIDGDTAIVGGDQMAGGQSRADVFVRGVDSTWSLQQQLGIPGSLSSIHQAVSISGNTALIGSVGGKNAAGAALVFVRSGSTWMQEQELHPDDGTPGDLFGGGVSVEGDTAIVGAPAAHGGGGAAYVFVRSGSKWTQKQELTPSAPSAGFGSAVSLSGETTVIGAGGGLRICADDSPGAAYVFLRSGATWSEQQRLQPSGSETLFGHGVSVDGDTAIVGAPGGDFEVLPHRYGGAAYLFVRSGSTWTQQQRIPGKNGSGAAVSVSGDTAVVGSNGMTGYDCVYDSGAATLFTRSGSDWSPVRVLSGPSGDNYDHFGGAVGISANSIVIGASGDGAAYVYHLGDATGDACSDGSTCYFGVCQAGKCAPTDVTASGGCSCRTTAEPEDTRLFACALALGAMLARRRRGWARRRLQDPDRLP